MSLRVLGGLLAIIVFVAPAALAQTTWHVDDDAFDDPGPGDPTVGDPLEDGTTAHPFDAIQEAIDASTDGDTVLVADGTYTGVGNKNVDYGGRAITVQSENGAETCIIDCEGDGRGFDFHNQESNSAVLMGVTVTNGHSGAGGGIRCTSSPTLESLIIRGNTSTATFGADGGGLCCQNGSALILRCVFDSNRAANGKGGGVFDAGNGSRIVECVITNNEADDGGGLSSDGARTRMFSSVVKNNVARSDGGGIYIRHGVTKFINCAIVNNSAWSDGGGAYLRSSALMINCIVAGNHAGDGGGLALTYATQTIANCTIAYNEARNGGGGLHLSDSATTNLTNSIVWGNTARWGTQAELVRLVRLRVDYSCVQDGADEIELSDDSTLNWRAGTITNDPVFRGDHIFDFHLGAGSPCIDAGSNTLVPRDTFDLDGDGDPNEPTPFDTDWESRLYDEPLTTDSGEGAPPIVDMGADEYQADCDQNGILDSLDLANCGGELWCQDCNGNGSPDGCDLDMGISADCNLNGIPDECDIANETSTDCNLNGIPDACDLAEQSSLDCNGNDIPDECDISDGYSEDCNDNGAPDECDISFGTSEDCNGNGIPDECDVDGSFVHVSPVLSPIGDGWAHEYILPAPTRALTTVFITVTARVDWDQNDEDVIVFVNDVSMPLFRGYYACAADPEPDQVHVSAATFNSAIGEPGADATITVTATEAVDPNECSPLSTAVVTIEYVGDIGTDCNGNDVPDSCDIDSGASQDCNLNGTPDECEIDCNENGVPDDCDIASGSSIDCDGSGIPDECETDCNGNGVLDECDLSDGVSEDCNLNAIPDECDIANATSTDCDDNLIPDECDLANGTLTDCDNDGAPDVCEVNVYRRGSGQLSPFGRGYPQSYVTPTPLAEGDVAIRFEAVGDLSLDTERALVYINDEYVGAVFRNANDCPGQPNIDTLPVSATAFNELAALGGITITMDASRLVNPFQCDPNDSFIAVSIEYESAGAGDCNGNDEPDECDIVNGTSADENNDGAPDECQDCNGNGQLDPTDIQQGLSSDCNVNGNPDECDVDSGASGDCNANGLPDECEEDCNQNGSPDECDILDGTSTDLNGNAIPDECEPDCNQNGAPDDFDIAVGVSSDCNGNTTPDECDIGDGTSEDCNENGAPDECDIADGDSRDFNLNGLPDECECVGDINGDARVNAVDLALLLGHYGDSEGSAYEDGDLDGDGGVDLSDLAILLAVMDSICS